MKLATFEDYIGSSILQRGKVYFEDGHVESLDVVEKDAWIASVIGSEEYFVEVEINKRGVVSEYQCNCPYDGSICKHVVAVLYAIREERTISLDVDNKTARKKKSKLSLRGLLDKISTDELKAFIVQYSKTHNNFKSDFELFFAEKDDNFDVEKHIRELIRKTTKSYSRRQFVDYGSSGKLARELGKILMQGDHYLSKNNLLDGSKVCMVFIKEVMPIISYADDSSGYLGDAIDNAVALLGDIAQQAPTSLKEKIAAQLRTELHDELYFEYGNFGHNMADLYAQLCVDIGQADQFIHFADVAIAKSKNDFFDYESSFFTELKAWVLEKSDRTEEAQQLMEQQIDIPKVRDLLVEKAIANKKFDEAKALLAEGIRLAAERKKHTMNAYGWEVKLLQIAEMEGDVDMVRYYSERFAFSGYFDERYYRRWKATFEDTTWDSVIEAKIAAIQLEIRKQKKANAWVDVAHWELQKLGPLYVEERLFDRLFALVRQQKDLDTVLVYHKHLYKSYPTELLSLYVPLFDHQAEAANNRSAYRSLLDTVRSIYNDLVSGQETLKQQLLRWKTMYKHRPAMIDELNKAFSQIK